MKERAGDEASCLDEGTNADEEQMHDSRSKNEAGDNLGFLISYRFVLNQFRGRLRRWLDTTLVEICSN